MTSEMRTTVELSDIKTIEIECQSCKARITRPISSWRSDVFCCGNCNAPWMVPHTPDYEKLKQLVKCDIHNATYGLARDDKVPARWQVRRRNEINFGVWHRRISRESHDGTVQSRGTLPAICHDQCCGGDFVDLKSGKAQLSVNPGPICPQDISVRLLCSFRQAASLPNAGIQLVGLNTSLVRQPIHGVHFALHFPESLTQRLSVIIQRAGGQVVGIANLKPLKAGEDRVSSQERDTEYLKEKFGVLPPLATTISGFILLGWGWWRMRRASSGRHAVAGLVALIGGYLLACIAGVVSIIVRF